MKLQSGMLAVLFQLGSLLPCGAQSPVQICQDGKCSIIVLAPLQEEVFIDTSTIESATASDEDHFSQVVKATVRVTISGVCGSGTIVGRDRDGNALVLTNAHVAGTQRGRVVNLERWNKDGSSEPGRGAIIASGYGRGMSIDFALLKCDSEFAKDVRPIPLADRYPSPKAMLTTNGCPRCEWPSLQVLKINRDEGQILSWKPEAIGGRSGSSLVDYTEVGPRVVGLLTWGGGGEGLGQSTPFLLQAMRGRLPQSLESLPEGVKEVGEPPLYVATWPTKPLPLVHQEVQKVPDDNIDQIVEPGNEEIEPTVPDKVPESPSISDSGILLRLSRWFRDRFFIALLIAAGFAGGYWYRSKQG